MAKPISTVEGFRKATVKKMKALGTYKKEYDDLIGVYSDLLFQYKLANDELANGGYQYETETAAGGMKKTAIASVLENLRKDIITYNDRLKLNPMKFQETEKEETKANPLTQFLSKNG